MSDIARDTPMPFPAVSPIASPAATAPKNGHSYALKADLEKLEEEQRRLKADNRAVQEAISGLRSTVTRGNEQILGAITTLTDAFNGHIAMHVSKDGMDQVRQSKSNEADLEHDKEIATLKAELAETKTLVSRAVVATGKGTIGVVGGGFGMVALDRFIHLVTDASFLESILRLLK